MRTILTLVTLFLVAAGFGAYNMVDLGNEPQITAGDLSSTLDSQQASIKKSVVAEKQQLEKPFIKKPVRENSLASRTLQFSLLSDVSLSPDTATTHVDISGPGIQRVLFSSILGESVLEAFSGGRIFLGDSIPPGMYVVRIETKREVSSRRVFKI